MDIKSFFDLRTHESEIVLSGVPISKYATERKEDIVIDTDRMYCPVGRTQHAVVVDLASVLTTEFVDEQDLKREAYLYDLVFNGCVVLFLAAGHLQDAQGVLHRPRRADRNAA